MRLADKDLNAFTPRMRRTKLLKEVNHALDVVDRLDNQIKIWDMKSNQRSNEMDILLSIMKDELKFLKEGKL